jgi:hypothetical protein
MNLFSRKICNGYMALGARGISVLFSSGDVHHHRIYLLTVLTQLRVVSAAGTTKSANATTTPSSRRSLPPAPG